MKHIVRTLIAGLILGLAAAAAAADARVVGSAHASYGHAGHWHGYWHAGGYWPGYRGWAGYRGGWGYGPHWRTGVALGIGVDLYPYPYYGYPAYPGYVVVAPRPGYYEGYYDPPPRHAPAKPDPQFAPRFGQGPGQTEVDRQACNRWAATQPEALADAAEFHRKSLACMEGRGYEVR
ncbi:MAG TPA: hypothetical protein VGQ91_01160 [Ideonella sp.]|jgi:hypothetical protein|nr:hypothetical protein [Ideonella sp.]